MSATEAKLGAGWYAALAGEAGNLRALARRFTTVIERDGEYFLPLSAVQGLNEADVRTHAERRVKLMNGAVRLNDAHQRPVKVGSLLRVAEDGHRGWFVALNTTLFIRGEVAVAHAEGRVPPSSDYDSLLQLAEADERVEHVLRLWSAEEIPYSELYKILEVVAAAVGGHHGLPATGWITATELSRFKGSAVHPAILGDEARHAVNRQPPVREPMLYPEALSLVQRVAKAWLDSLS